MRGRALSAWVWALLGIGDGWPGVGCFGVAWGWGMADYVQRSSGLLAACGAIDLCRGGLPIVRYLKASSLETSNFLCHSLRIRRLG